MQLSHQIRDRELIIKKFAHIWHLKIRNFELFSHHDTTFYHQFCLCRDFLVPPANFLRCSHITSPGLLSLLSPKIHYTCIIPLHYPPALSPCFTGGLTGLQRYNMFHWITPIQGSFLIIFNSQMGLRLGCWTPQYLKPNKVGEWCCAWWVHQQFNLLKAVQRLHE